MRLILSFVILLVSLFQILLVIVTQLNLFVNLIDVNRKRPRERFVNKKSRCQHGFTKTCSSVNTLMMSIHFYELILLFFIFHHNFCSDNVTIFSKAMSGVIIFLQMSFLRPIVSFTVNSTVLLFSIYHTKTFYLAHIFFTVLVSLFTNIRFLQTTFFIIFLM